MTPCRRCSRPAKKYGPPVLHGVFLDQILDCPKCGWCGVETVIIDPKKHELVQMTFDLKEMQ